MLAILCMTLSVLAGWSLVRLFPFAVRRIEALSMSVAIGIPLVSWLIFICAKLLAFPIGLPVALVLTALICTTQAYIPSRTSFIRKPYSTRFRAFAWVGALVIAFIVGQLIYLSYQLPGPDGNWLSNGNAWGDAPLHISYANQFSMGDTVDLVSPSYLKVPLTYPFIGDFYSGILLRLGASWSFSLFAPSLLTTLALLYLIYSFGYRLLGSARASWMQLILIVFSGAVHGGWQLTQILFTQGTEAYNAFIGVSIPLSTHDNYLNFIHSHIIPQRSYLFGMALLLVILTGMLELYRAKPKQAWLQLKDLTRKKTLLSLFKNRAARSKWLSSATLPLVVSIGMLPLVHAHSFLVLVGLSVLATLGLAIYRQALPKAWLTVFVGGFLLAVPQVLWQFRSTYDKHFQSWIHGWVMKDFSLVDGDVFGFWFGQIGVLLLVILFGWLILRRMKVSAELWLFYLAGVGIFLICNIYVFQPSVWDNMKFFEYALWFQMLVSGYIMAVWSRHWWAWIALIPIIFSLTIMGWYTLALTGPQLTFEMLSKDEVAFGTSMQKALPQDAYVLVGDRHNHPITMLSGHKVLMTYAGWYNLYNSQWPVVNQERSEMLKGTPDASALLAKYGITHAVFSDSEITNGDANLEYFQEHYTLLTHSANWWVFDIRKPLLTSPPVSQ